MTPFPSPHLTSLVRKPGAGNPPARFDERGVETEHGRDDVAPAHERAGQQGTQTSTYTTAPHLDSTIDASCVPVAAPSFGGLWGPAVFLFRCDSWWLLDTMLHESVCSRPFLDVIIDGPRVLGHR